MEIHLLRHTAIKNMQGICYGQADVALADTFEEDAAAINLRDEYDMVLCSPSSRCTLLADQLNLTYHTDPRLMEINFGDWELQAWNDIDQRALTIWMEEFVHIAPPNGESLFEMNKRVTGLLEELKNEYRKVLLISHAGVIRIVSSKLNVLALNEMFRIKVEYGELVKLRW